MIGQGITTVTSQDQLARFMNAYPQIAILYVHPDMLAAIDETQLRAYYQQGIVIVALNTPHTMLGAKLGVNATLQDIPHARLDRLPANFLSFSLYYSYSNGLQSVSTTGQTTDIASDFDTLLPVPELYAQQIAEAKGEATVPERIVNSPMTPREKFSTFFEWVRSGCLWRACM